MAAESRACAVERRAAAERQLLATELAASELRVVRLCHRLHTSMAANLAYDGELQQARRAAGMQRAA